MSLSLAPEILDLIVDHLHDEPAVLRACCLASKSWVPRTRIHLFDRVELYRTGSSLESWAETFPDPSGSPAHCTRSLRLSNLEVTTVGISNTLPWIHSFNNIVELEVVGVGVKYHNITFTQLRGLSPTLKYLHIFHSLTLLPEVVDFIYSFPLLEDLSMSYIQCHDWENIDSWDPPPISPKFNGSLLLNCSDRGITRKLLDFQGCLHFSKITVSCHIEDCDLVGELVSTCSDTLEYLDIDFYRHTGNPWTPPSLDLSKAAKLRDVEFRPREPSIGWINAALRTVESNILRQITIHFTTASVPLALLGPIDETTRLEWQELDHLLVHLWTTRSIRPTFHYRPGGLAGSGVLIALLPKLARRGAVYGV